MPVPTKINSIKTLRNLERFCDDLEHPVFWFSQMQNTSLRLNSAAKLHLLSIRKYSAFERIRESLNQSKLSVKTLSSQLSILLHKENQQPKLKILDLDVLGVTLFMSDHVPQYTRHSSKFPFTNREVFGIELCAETPGKICVLSLDVLLPSLRGEHLKKLVIQRKNEGKPLLLNSIVHPEDLPKLLRDFTNSRVKKAQRFNAVFRILTEKKIFQWVNFTGAFSGTKSRLQVVKGHIEVIDETIKQAELQSNLQLETLEAERKRFAMELHDGLAQHFVLVSMYLNQLKMTAENETIIQQCKSVLQDGLNQTRALCYSITPPELENGLINGLEVLLDRISTLNKIEVSKYIQHEIRDHQFKDIATYHVFRIIQEFIQNSLKHAQCSKILFSATKSGNKKIFQLSDNGVGYDLGQVKRGMGLNNMDKRAKVCGIELKLKSKPGTGTFLEMIV